jgi:hypothetical protein
MFNKVLVAIDGSDASNRALDMVGKRLGEAESVVAVHVYEHQIGLQKGSAGGVE